MRQNKNEIYIVPGWGFVSCHRAAGCRGHGVGRSVLPL